MSNAEGSWIFNGMIVDKFTGTGKTSGKEYHKVSILIGKAVFDFFSKEPCALNIKADVRGTCEIEVDKTGKANFSLKSLM